MLSGIRQRHESSVQKDKLLHRRELLAVNTLISLSEEHFTGQQDKSSYAHNGACDMRWHEFAVGGIGAL